MKSFVRFTLIMLAGLTLLLLASFGGQAKISDKAISSDVVATQMVTYQNIIKAQSLDINELPFLDNADIYQYDDPGSVVTRYVTVKRGNAAAAVKQQ